MAGCALASTAEEAIRIAGPDRFANLGKTCESEFTDSPARSTARDRHRCRSPKASSKRTSRPPSSPSIVGEWPGSFSVYWAVKEDAPNRSLPT
jgi:hypothetical protein